MTSEETAMHPAPGPRPAALGRAAIRAEMESARLDFHRLIGAATPADLRRPSDGTRWTNQQLLFHKLFGYTTSGAGTGLANGAEIFAITVRRAIVTTRDVGPTKGGDCGSLALSPGGTLYSMCGPLFGAQQLATINQETGHARLFGVPVPGLAVMAMAFGPDGTLYAVGGCNPDPVTFECTPGPATYNSLYKVNKRTGAFTLIGPTGAPELFMDLTFDSHGNMLGETSTVNPSATPAKLYQIDPATGMATKLFDLVGSTSVMGLAFGRDGKLYATDNPPNPHLYLINTTTGVETTIAALPFSFSSGLELMN